MSESRDGADEADTAVQRFLENLDARSRMLRTASSALAKVQSHLLCHPTVRVWRHQASLPQTLRHLQLPKTRRSSHSTTHLSPQTSYGVSQR